MTNECPNCRPGVTCAACLDFAHTAHRANGTDHGYGAADHLARALSEDPRYVGAFAAPDVRGLVNHLRASPLYQTDPLLHATVKRITLGGDPLAALGDAMLAFAEERARLLKMATLAATLNGPVILAPVDAFSAPAHNPGARVVPTGGGR